MRRYLPIALPAAAALGLSILAVFFVPHPVGAIWKGYRLVLVDAKVEESRVLEGLRAAGFKEILSESNQPLQVSNYQALVDDSLGSVLKRMTQADPRWDSYIAGLGKWFHADLDGQDYRVFYVRTGLGPGLAVKVAKALEGIQTSAILPETGSDESLPLAAKTAIFFAAVGLALLTGKRREGLLSILALLPWLVTAMTGKAAAFAAGLAAPAIVFAVHQSLAALDELNNPSGIFPAFRVFLRSEASALPLFGPALALMCLSPGLIPSSLASLFAGCAYCLGFEALEKHRGKARKAFTPVLIGRQGLSIGSRPKRSQRLYVASFSALALVMAIGLSFSFLPRGSSSGSGMGEISLPQPVGERSGQKPSPIDALALRSTGRGEELVNMADWLVHRWYQEALFYLPLKSLDLPVFSSVSVPLPLQKSAALRIYDAAWARESFKNRPRGGIEGLLLGEATFVRCFRRPFDMAKSRPLAPIEVILYIILLAPASAGAISLKKKGTRNRREQRQAE